MASEPLLNLIAGADCNRSDAVLPGYVLRGADDACFPQLQPGTGEVAGTLVCNLSGATLDRLSYFAAGLGYESVPAHIRSPGPISEAIIFRTPTSGTGYGINWTEDGWREKWGQIALFATEEVLSHHGQFGPEDLRRMMPMILVRASARVAASGGVPRDVRSDMAAAQVDVLERHNRHAGFFLTREYTLRHPTFDGGMSPPVRREVFVATDAAIVLPYDPLRDRVLLVEQFRMGPYGRGDPHPWMLEPVAGRVDPGEDPETTARRECREEAGLPLNGLEHISSHYCSLGCSTEYFHCYVGLCDLPDLNAGQGGLESEDEDIRTHVLPFDRAMALIPSGEAANGPLILCLLWLERERKRLRAKAGSGA